MKKFLKYVAVFLSGALIASGVFLLSDRSLISTFDVENSLAVMAEATVHQSSNQDLLEDAYAVLNAIRDRNYDDLSGWVHPEVGVYFTPYSTVELEVNMHFTPEEVKKFATCTNTYVWGTVDGEGSPISMTPSGYFDRYVYDANYAEAPIIGIDKINRIGNSLENVKDVFPDSKFIEMHFPGTEAYGGIDWRSLKLVFTGTDKGNKLVAIIHSEWTV
jgi:hypothetical protein